MIINRKDKMKNNHKWISTVAVFLNLKGRLLPLGDKSFRTSCGCLEVGTTFSGDKVISLTGNNERQRLREIKVGVLQTTFETAVVYHLSDFGQIASNTRFCRRYNLRDKTKHNESTFYRW